MSHPIVHIEISANNLQETAKWYGDLFGWSSQEFPEMNYATFTTGEGQVGGGFNPVEGRFPAGTIVFYIQTDDIKGHLARIEAKGGKTVLPWQDIPGMGAIALFTDPTGNMVGLWQMTTQ